MTEGKVKRYRTGNRKKVAIIIGAVLAVLLIAAGAYAYLNPGGFGRILYKGFGTVKLRQPKVAAVTTCPLDGTAAKDDINQPPLIVKIDNAPQARPQAGLNDACLVYEVLVEGGGSRYAAVFLCHDSGKVGPVRSSRFSDVDITSGLKAILVHAGGTQVTLDKLDAAGVPQISGLKESYGFWRGTGRSAPHNLYTETRKLRTLAKRKGLNVRETVPRFEFKKDSPAKEPLSGVSIRFSDTYGVSYRYLPSENRFQRYVSGTISNDLDSGKGIAPKNVIVQFTVINETNFREDSVGSKSLQPELVGSGNGLLLIDGKTRPVKWSKADHNKPTVYTYPNGKEVQLNVGQTWFEIIRPNAKAVTVTR